MGYHLIITRRTDPEDPKSGPPITREEFERIVLTDPRFRADDDGDTSFVWWSDVPTQWRFLPPAYLSWVEGNIRTNHPPRPLITIAHGIATALDARLVGEEGEEYGADGRTIEEILMAASAQQVPCVVGELYSEASSGGRSVPQRPWRKRLFRIAVWTLAVFGLYSLVVGVWRGW